MGELLMYVTKTISAANQWSNPLFLSEFYNYSAQLATGINVTVQRSFDKGMSWEDFETNASPFSKVGFAPPTPPSESANPVMYRIGVKAGGAVASPVAVRLGV